MDTIPSQIQTSSQQFKDNDAHMTRLVGQLREHLASARLGGGPQAHERHAQLGKLAVRDRVVRLLDPASPFLELSPLAAHGMYDGEAPAAGLVTGIGRVAGREVLVLANDATVKGGTYFPITVKKHLRAQQVAMENRLPCVYLVDSGGAFLPLQAEVFPDREHFGRIFFNQARMSAEGIPQIAVVMGSCTAGGAYVPAMADQTVIVKGTGTIFLAGPPLVRAATGEDVSAEDLGGADVHARVSGVADYLAADDAHALAITRSIVSALPHAKRLPPGGATPEDPAYDPAETLRDRERGPAAAVRRSRGAGASGGRLTLRRVQAPLRAHHRDGLRARPGLAGRHHRQQRRAVLGVGAQGHALHPAVRDARHPPGLRPEHHRASWSGSSTSGPASPRTGRRWSTPWPTCPCRSSPSSSAGRSAPATTVCAGAPTTRASCGCGPTRASRSWGASRPPLCWRRSSAISGRAKAGRSRTEEETAIRAPILEKYETEGSPYYSTARVWDDGILDPVHTRDALALGVSASYNAPVGPARYGVFRM